MRLSDNNPYRIKGYDDDIGCCYNENEESFAGCQTPSVWFYGWEGDVFFRCDKHRYPVDDRDNEEGEGPWNEMTRNGIAKEWEIRQIMEK